MTPSSNPVPPAATSRWYRGPHAGAAVTILCGACLVAGAGTAPAGINVWTSNGPPGGVLALALDPTKAGTLYAGGWYGVFKSTDAGGTWSSTNAPTIDGSPFALAIDPSRPHILYWAGLGDPAGNPKGVFKSTDAGATWSATGLTGTPVSSLAIDPITPSTLYAETYGGGLFKSTDAGATWETANTGLPDTSLNAVALAIDPTNPTTLYAGGVDLFKSTDAGVAWSTTGLPGFVLALAIDPITTSTLYAVVNDAPCGSCQGVYKSTDAGVNWSATGLPWGVEPALALDPVTPRTLYVGTFVGVSKSNDGGDTWTPLNTGLMNLDVTSLAIDPIEPRRVYAATDRGVFAIEQVSACAGDCSGDGQVTVNEIITMVNIALGTGSMVECGTGDGNHDNQISIDEILTAVNAALNGCPAPPMPTPRFLTEDATLYDYWPSFSPDGRSLLFSRTADGVHWELRQVPVAGGQSISFASTPLPVSATRANWSPSGDRVAFTGVSANGLAALWLISATGMDAHRVTVGGLSGLVFYPSFYPDGNRLAITDLGAGGLNGGVVRMVDLAQATVTSLTNHSEILAGMPAVSPNGQRVAFAGQRNVGQRYDETQNSIFMLEPNGAVTQPDAGLGRAPAWSPDGEWIAFESSRASPDGRYAAFVMRTDGTRLRQLTDVSMDANHPVFSPDGKLLAFSASQPGWPITARGIAVIEVPDL